MRKSKQPKYKFSNLQRVTFDTGTMKGNGLIRGCSADGVYLLGKTYIIQVLESEPPIDRKAYPFDNIAVPELFINRPPAVPQTVYIPQPPQVQPVDELPEEEFGPGIHFYDGNFGGIKKTFPPHGDHPGQVFVD